MISFKKIPFFLFTSIIFTTASALSYSVTESHIFERGISGITCMNNLFFFDEPRQFANCTVEIEKVNSMELFKNLSESEVASINCSKNVTPNKPANEYDCEITIPGVFCTGHYSDHKLTSSDCTIDEAKIDMMALYESLTKPTYSNYREECFDKGKFTDCPTALN